MSDDALKFGHKTEVQHSPVVDQAVTNFMQGKQYSPGTRYTTEPKGISSGPEPLSTTQAVLDAGGSENLNRGLMGEEEPMLHPPETQDFKKLYGQSENEKGEWRRQAMEQEEKNKALQAELRAMQSAGFSQTPPQQYAPPQQTYTPVYAPQQQPQRQERFFPDKEETDLVQVADVERMVQTQIAPAFQSLYQQNMQLAQAQYQWQKASMGITPQVEQDLVSRYSWLNGVPEGPQKLEAMSQLVSQEAQQKQEVEERKVPSSSEHAATRATYVEGTTPSAGAQEVSLDQIIQQELAEAMQKPWGVERRQALEAVFAKYGVGHVNDWGPEYLGIDRR